jgi:DNA-directed RNA polymerase specialized sigma24 family protein
MSSLGSVSHWIARLKRGDSAAAQRLWEDYFQRLVGLARAKLRGVPRREADEEDVALSAFDSFCRGAARGRFSRLADRTDLWQLLALITVRKAIDLVHRTKRARAGGGRLRGESALEDAKDSASGEAGLARIVSQEPTPEMVAQFTEQCRRLLQMLGDDKLRAVALWKLEGYRNEEIAGKLGCVTRTVEWKLKRIRTIWNHEVAT